MIWYLAGAVVVLLLFLGLKSAQRAQAERAAGVYGRRFVYVNEDGSARTLYKDEARHLNQEYALGDGARPYIKSRYGSRAPDGAIAGYLPRVRLPRKIAKNLAAVPRDADDRNFRLRVAALARKVQRKELTFFDFLRATESDAVYFSSGDGDVDELIDLLEHEPREGFLLGVRHAEYAVYAESIDAAIVKLESTPP